MSVFSASAFDQHEQVVFGQDPLSGLCAIIAIHNTNLGPALGGCRMYPYASEQDALEDALRLARGMTYKSALAGLPLGGGKAVIIGDPAQHKTEALFAAMGRMVHSLNGRYIVAQDSGITADDLKIMARHCDHIAVTEMVNAEGQKINADPSPSTAYGVFLGIQAAVRQHLKREQVAGIKVAIQGLGNVGYRLAELLAEAGAELWVADSNARKVDMAVQNLQATAVASSDIASASVDVFAPCAMGASINDQSIAELQATIVAGAANNQLAEPRHALELQQRGILYAPDYVINAGGIIDVHYLRLGMRIEDIRAHVSVIGDTLSEIFKRAAAQGDTPENIAEHVAEERFKSREAEPPKSVAQA